VGVPGACKKIGASADQQKYVDMAYEISGGDKDFVYLLEAESGTWTIDRKSKKVGSNGYYDYGFAQINKGFHKEIVNDPRFFKDPYWQIQQAYKLYKGGTRFYAKKNIPRIKKNFECNP